MKNNRIDRVLFILTIILVVLGFTIFLSASLGLLTREGARFGAVALKQLVFGIGLGSIALLIASNINYKLWRKYSFYFFLGAFFLTLLVFIPGVGFEHGGARRWVEVFSFSFQPGELLKLAFIVYFASWLSAVKKQSDTIKFGLLPLLGLSLLVGGVLLFQPDTDGFLIIILAGFMMLFVAGASWKHLMMIIIAGMLLGGSLIMIKPYLKERVMTFINLQNVDSLNAGYQISQSFIAIGSGGMWGRGFGQSIQKFEYLPEPIGDSIFAVAAEEFGFWGASLLIILFLLFGLRGLRLANHAPDIFAQLLTVGILIHIIGQSFLNIASMLGLFPLSGTPLIFVSQGGTALLIALLEVGILLNISRYQKS
jgi:cell division protein FtsW